MTVNPNAFVMTILAEQRGAEFRAQAARDRLAELAVRHDGDQHFRRWPGTRAMIAAFVASALLLAAGAASAQETAPAPGVDAPGTSAVQKVREAAK